MIDQVRLAPPDTRTRLVLAAMHLFWEKGYGSTSIADVLKSAAVNSGSLYHFFPGKQELLLAVLDAYHGGIGPTLLEPAWRGVEDPIERIFALLARYRRSLTDTDCSYGCPIGSLALELHEPDPAGPRAPRRELHRLGGGHPPVPGGGRRTAAARPRAARARRSSY